MYTASTFPWASSANFLPADDFANGSRFNWIHTDDTTLPCMSDEQSIPLYSFPYIIEQSASPSISPPVDELILDEFSEWLNFDIPECNSITVPQHETLPNVKLEHSPAPSSSPSVTESLFVPSPNSSNTPLSLQSSPSPPPSSMSSLPPRRRPGRPSKALLAARAAKIGKAPSGRALASARREMHNDSAKQSRVRLNTAIDELWGTLPKSARIVPPGSKPVCERDLSRADKVGIALSYMRILQEQGGVNSSGQSSLFFLLGNKRWVI